MNEQLTVLKDTKPPQPSSSHSYVARHTKTNWAISPVNYARQKCFLAPPCQHSHQSYIHWQTSIFLTAAGMTVMGHMHRRTLLPPYQIFKDLSRCSFKSYCIFLRLAIHEYQHFLLHWLSGDTFPLRRMVLSDVRNKFCAAWHKLNFIESCSSTALVWKLTQGNVY